MRTLWIEYCGVCNEYIILKHKWITYTNEPYLPNINCVFDNIEKIIYETDIIFSKMGFEKVKKDNNNDFCLTSETNIIDIEKRFLNLAQYLGFLRIVFIQRTASIEIPFIIENYPTSPEINIGNEAQYVVADILAKNYIDSIIQFKKYKWDRVISFTYPLEHFYGGYFSYLPTFNYYHIGISEEAKSFSGKFSLLAHEISHSIMSYSTKTDKEDWVCTLVGTIYSHADLKPLKTDAKTIVRKCKQENCVFDNEILETLSNKQSFSYFLEDCFCDLIALKIGGLSTIRSLVDIAINDMEVLARLSFVSRFIELELEEYKKNKDESNIKLYNYIHSEIKIELGNLIKYITKYGAKKNINVNKCKPCYIFISVIGEQLGDIFYEENKDFKIVKLLIKLINQQGIEKSNNEKSILKNIIKKEFCYKDVEKIQNILLNHQLVNISDPRIIIEAFYNNYRKNIGADYICAIFNIMNSSIP